MQSSICLMHHEHQAFHRLDERRTEDTVLQLPYEDAIRGTGNGGKAPGSTCFSDLVTVPVQSYSAAVSVNAYPIMRY